MKSRSMLLAILSLILIPMSLNAWDTRLLGLGSPTLAIGEGVPSALSTAIGLLPTDQFNVGLSAIPDPVDIFTLPQQLGNEKLFPSNALIAEWTGANAGNGGLVMKPKGPMTFAIFLLRPGNNGFVVGGPRAAFAGLGASFFANSTATVTAPSAPNNIFDLFFSYKLGNILLGGSVGFAYGLAANVTASTAGNATSNVTDTSSTLAATGRLGASLPLGPVGFDAGVVVVVGNASAKEVTGATPPAPYGANLNDSLTATNVALAVNARASLPLAQNLDLAGIGNFSMLPQNYSATALGANVDTTTARIDPSGIWSAGTGAGITWKASDAFVVNGYVSAIVGAGNWVSVAGGVTPRPTNSTLWVTLRPLLSGELKPASWLTVRGGVSYSGTYNTTTINANTGTTQSTTVTWTTGVTANAGVSVQLTDKAILEMVLNLTNFTSAGIGPLATPFAQTSLKMDL